MDFFQAQDSAHRNTTRLVIFFTLAVLSLIVITNLLVMVLFGFIETSEEGATLNSLATQFDWQVFFVVSAGVLIVIVGGSAYKTMTLSAGGAIAFVDDPEPLIQRAKPGMAFMLGAMGSPTTNFYNDAYKRGGFEDVAIRVQELWIEGRRDEAIGAVPDEMIREVSLIGDEAHVRAQLRKYVAAGIDVFRISPHGANATERLDTLGRAVELIQQETA